LTSFRYVSLNVFTENSYILNENNTIGNFIFDFFKVLFALIHKIFELEVILFDAIIYILRKSFFIREIDNYMNFIKGILENFMNFFKTLDNYFIWWLIDHNDIEFSKLNEKDGVEECGENTRLLLASLSLDSTFKEIFKNESIYQKKSFTKDIKT
uniref:Uncharacterized protein n=1 Tax=Strongyloides stercoralis TaxID=6248 RepID=A0AAF5D0B4_STRER